MPVSYANLQLMLPPQTEAAAEKIYFALCTYMDAQGFIPCQKESAERTVAFVRGETSWTLFDDCADRLDINVLDGLGRTLSRKLHVRARRGDGQRPHPHAAAVHRRLSAGYLYHRG